MRSNNTVVDMIVIKQHHIVKDIPRLSYFQPAMTLKAPFVSTLALSPVQTHPSSEGDDEGTSIYEYSPTPCIFPTDGPRTISTPIGSSPFSTDLSWTLMSFASALTLGGPTCATCAKGSVVFLGGEGKICRSSGCEARTGPATNG